VLGLGYGSQDSVHLVVSWIVEVAMARLAEIQRGASLIVA
jgi:hypothetical protein